MPLKTGGTVKAQIWDTGKINKDVYDNQCIIAGQERFKAITSA